MNPIINISSSIDLSQTQTEILLQTQTTLQTQAQTQLQLARTPQEFIQTLNNMNLSQASDTDVQSIGNAVASIDTRFIVCVANAAPDPKSIAPIMPIILDAMSEQAGFLTSNGLKNIANGLKSADVMDTCARMSGFCPCRTDVEDTHYVTRAQSVKAESKCQEYLQQYNPILQSSANLTSDITNNNTVPMEESGSTSSAININDLVSDTVISALESNSILENNAALDEEGATVLQAEILQETSQVQHAAASYEMTPNISHQATGNGRNRNAIQSNSTASVVIPNISNSANIASLTQHQSPILSPAVNISYNKSISSLSITPSIYIDQLANSTVINSAIKSDTLNSDSSVSEQPHTKDAKEIETTDGTILNDSIMRNDIIKNDIINDSTSNTNSSDSAHKETKSLNTKNIFQSTESNANTSAPSSNNATEIISMDSTSAEHTSLEINGNTKNITEMIKSNLTGCNSVLYSLEVENKTLLENAEISLVNNELQNSVQNHAKHHNIDLAALNSSANNKESVTAAENNTNTHETYQDIHYSILYQALLMLLTSLISFSLYPSTVYPLRVYAIQNYLYSRYYSLLIK